MRSRPLAIRYPGYQLFMLGLCLNALVILALRVALPMSESMYTILEYADNAMCVLFLVDFILSVVFAPDRWQYLRTWGWLDLLSAIPAWDMARWGRAARVLRIVRVLRGLKATKLLATLVLERRAANTVLGAGLVALVLLTFSCLAILHFEADIGNIKTAEDAVWWSFATITTVGYGDRYPITTEGRMIAILLMGAGVGLFGTFAGFLASWFVGPSNAQETAELVKLREEIGALRRELASQRAASTQPLTNGEATSR